MEIFSQDSMKPFGNIIFPHFCFKFRRSLPLFISFFYALTFTQSFPLRRNYAFLSMPRWIKEVHGINAVEMASSNLQYLFNEILRIVQSHTFCSHMKSQKYELSQNVWDWESSNMPRTIRATFWNSQTSFGHLVIVQVLSQSLLWGEQALMSLDHQMVLSLASYLSNPLHTNDCGIIMAQDIKLSHTTFDGVIIKVVVNTPLSFYSLDVVWA